METVMGGEVDIVRDTTREGPQTDEAIALHLQTGGRLPLAVQIGDRVLESDGLGVLVRIDSRDFVLVSGDDLQRVVSIAQQEGGDIELSDEEAGESDRILNQLLAAMDRTIERMDSHEERMQQAFEELRKLKEQTEVL